MSDPYVSRPEYLNASAINTALGYVPFNQTGDTLTGGSGSGFYGVPAQSSDPATPVSGFRLFADAVGRLAWKGTNGFRRVFDGTANTADRAYTLPDVSGNVSVMLAPSTFAGLPAASSVPVGTEVWVTDVGDSRTKWYSDGTNWRLVQGSADVMRHSSARGIAPSSTIATGSSGHLTLGTALSRTYSEGLFLYINSPSTTPVLSAQLYWVVMSSASVGTIYSTTWASSSGVGTPTIGSAINFTVGASTTGVTGSDLTCYSTTIKANSLGATGHLDCYAKVSVNSNANGKIARAKLGGTTFLADSNTSRLSSALLGTINNRTASVNIGQGGWAQNSSSTSVITGTVDTTADQTLVYTANLATATDYVLFENAKVAMSV